MRGTTVLAVLFHGLYDEAKGVLGPSDCVSNIEEVAKDLSVGLVSRQNRWRLKTATEHSEPVEERSIGGF